MLFNSFSFLLFFPIFLLLYFKIAKKHQWKLLLLSGYYFYGSFAPKYLLILVAITLNDYFAGVTSTGAGAAVASVDFFLQQDFAFAQDFSSLEAQAFASFLQHAFFSPLLQAFFSSPQASEIEAAVNNTVIVKIIFFISKDL